MSWKRLIVAAGLAAAGPMACQLVAGLDGDFVQAPVPDVDAGVDADAAPDVVEAGTSGCARATYPDPPSGSDAADLPPIVLAVRTLDLGESTQTPPGYDLDNTCSCAFEAGPSCMSDKQHCDGPGGVDNGSAQFFKLVQVAAGSSTFSSEAFSAKIEAGTFSLIIRVTKYNGKADDPSVQVAMYPSSGALSAPTWGGADAWGIQGQSVIADDPDQPVYKSEGAYVSKGTLVAALPAIEATLGAEENSMKLLLTGGVLTGTLVDTPSGWSIASGLIAARWRIQDVFAALSTYRDSNGKPICTDLAIVYQTAKAAICNGLDILADPAAAKTERCDALSIGIGYTAYQAAIGSVEAPPTPLPGCPDATDPIHDTCF